MAQTWTRHGSNLPLCISKLVNFLFSYIFKAQQVVKKTKPNQVVLGSSLTQLHIYKCRTQAHRIEKISIRAWTQDKSGWLELSSKNYILTL